MDELKLFDALKAYDTPSITNVLATYPNNREFCLGLYTPWETNWYTDESIRCMYPELGRTVGCAVTCIYGLPASDSDRLSFSDVLRAIDKVQGPVVVVIKQNLPPSIKKKSGLSGGNMTTAFKALGVVGVISDGPSRDIDEIRPMGVQYMLTGVTPGHGNYGIKAINVPVSVCGMDIAPGEIIHMDENGAVKFPREMLDRVSDYAEKLQKIEALRQKMIRETNDVEKIIRIMDGLEDE